MSVGVVVQADGTTFCESDVKVSVAHTSATFSIARINYQVAYTYTIQAKGPGGVGPKTAPKRFYGQSVAKGVSTPEGVYDYLLT